jgi:hypothetical protein
VSLVLRGTPDTLNIDDWRSNDGRTEPKVFVEKSFKIRRMQHRTSKGPGPANRPNKSPSRASSPGLGPAVLSHLPRSAVVAVGAVGAVGAAVVAVFAVLCFTLVLGLGWG